MKQLDNCPIRPATESKARSHTRLTAGQQLAHHQDEGEAATDGKVKAAEIV
jgi:hypothetical protein